MSGVGVYSAAQTLLLMILFLPGAFQTAIEPVFSRLYAHARHILPQFYQLGYKLFLLMGFPMALGILLVGNYIVSLVYGNKFEGSYAILCVLAVYLVTLPTYANGPLLRMTGRQHLFAIIQGLTVSGQAVLCVLLVPIWGPIGAAVSLVVGESVAFVVTSIICHNYLKLPLPWLTMAKVFASTLLMGLVTSISLSRGVYWPIAGFLIAPSMFVLSTLALRTVDRSDLQILTSVSGLGRMSSDEKPDCLQVGVGNDDHALASRL